MVANRCMARAMTPTTDVVSEGFVDLEFTNDGRIKM